MDCDDQLALIQANFWVFWMILAGKVGHTNLVLVCDQGSLVGLCMQDYKYLSAVVCHPA